MLNVKLEIAKGLLGLGVVLKLNDVLCKRGESKKRKTKGTIKIEKEITNAELQMIHARTKRKIEETKERMIDDLIDNEKDRELGHKNLMLLIELEKELDKAAEKIGIM